MSFVHALIVRVLRQRAWIVAVAGAAACLQDTPTATGHGPLLSGTTGLPTLKPWSGVAPVVAPSSATLPVPPEWRAAAQNHRRFVKPPSGVQTVSGAQANLGTILRDDVLETTATGDRKAWGLGAGGVILDAVFLGNMPVSWHIAGVGDFDGDGHQDLLWENHADGTRLIWFMDC